ncbi:MopE-related protein [Nannocystaceae bacterium ST9]
MTSRLAFSTLLLPLLGVLASCGGDDQTTDDEVGDTGSTDSTGSTDDEASASESSDTADTTASDTADTTASDTTASDTSETTADTSTSDTSETTGEPVDADMDGVPSDLDCDDADPQNFPGNSEICDGQDNDCDENVDNDPIDAGTYFGDADMDGYGAGEGFSSCEVPPGTSQVGGDCNDDDPDAYPDANDVCALGRTCLAIYESGAGIDDGVYLVDPAGVDVGGEPVEVWCDMTNGGLTAALVINSVNEGTYIGDFGGAYFQTDLLAADPAQASNQSADAIQAWLDLNEYEYVDFRLAAYSDTNNSFTSGWIARTSLRIEFGQNGYLLYGEPANNYSWCGGAATYTDNGQGQINKPPNAPTDCKGHASLGSGWDFSLSGSQYNLGLTLCGPDASAWMYRNYANSIIYYPNAGAAYVVWTR